MDICPPSPPPKKWLGWLWTSGGCSRGAGAWGRSGGEGTVTGPGGAGTWGSSGGASTGTGPGGVGTVTGPGGAGTWGSSGGASTGTGPGGVGTGTGPGGAGTWGHSGGAGTGTGPGGVGTGTALEERALEGTLEEQALERALEERALERALEEWALEWCLEEWALEERTLEGTCEERALEGTHSNTYPHMPPIIPGAHGRLPVALTSLSEPRTSAGMSEPGTAACMSEPRTAECLQWPRTAAGMSGRQWRRACVGCECGGLDCRTADGLEGWLVLDRAWDTLQTPENPFPPDQSCGVWEVHGAMVVGPDPEQRIQHSVIEPHPNGEPAELSRVLGRPGWQSTKPNKDKHELKHVTTISRICDSLW